MNEKDFVTMAGEYGAWLNGTEIVFTDRGVVEFACAIIRHDKELNDCRKVVATQALTIESMKQQLSILKPIQGKQNLAVAILEKAEVIERFDNNTVTVRLIEDWFSDFEFLAGM